MPSVELQWTPAGGSVTSQKVYRGLPGKSLALIATVPAAASSYTDSTVSANTSYDYMVQSVCSSGGPTDSTTVSVTTGGITAVNLLVIPNAPPQTSEDNILQTVEKTDAIINGLNPIADSWGVMGWFRMDHTLQELQGTSSTGTMDTLLFGIEEDYDVYAQAVQTSGQYDPGHMLIYREASSSGDYLTVEIQDNSNNYIKYQYLLSSASNTAITGILSSSAYWDNTAQGTNNLIHIAVSYNSLASLVNRVTVYWNGSALTISSAPFNSAPSDGNWTSTEKRLVLGWAIGISGGYSGHSGKISIDELGFYHNTTLSSANVSTAYNGGTIEVQSNLLLTPDLEWSFESDGSENGSLAAAEFSFNNPPGVNQYGNGPYVFVNSQALVP